MEPYSLPPGFIGFCAFCILNLNSAYPYHVGLNNTGLAKDREGEEIAFGPEDRMLWQPGNSIVAGFRLSLIFLMFGDHADIRHPGDRGRVTPWAVTMRDGTLVCSDCNSTWQTRLQGSSYRR
jgi:hypothetical protein